MNVKTIERFVFFIPVQPLLMTIIYDIFLGKPVVGLIHIYEK